MSELPIRTRRRVSGGSAISEDLCPTGTRAKSTPFAGPVLGFRAGDREPVRFLTADGSTTRLLPWKYDESEVSGPVDKLVRK